MQQYSDEQLMQLIKNKKDEALHELYGRYAKLVYSFAMKSKRDPQFAGEIVQLVFTRLWTTDRGYDSSRGKFVNWLLTITRNISIDQLRKERKLDRLVPFDSAAEASTAELSLSDEPLSLENPVSRRLFKQQVEEAYRYLSDNQIRLIRLFYWEGYTLTEIAKISGEPVGTIKSRLHQTLKLLRRHMTPWREE